MRISPVAAGIGRSSAIAMQRILAGEADAIIVWKVSRFSRNWREAAEDVELLLENDKDLLSEEGFDTASTGGRLLLRILFVLANWEHEVLGEHWEVIKTKAVRDRGSHLGAAPTGYVVGAGGVPDPRPRRQPTWWSSCLRRAQPGRRGESWRTCSRSANRARAATPARMCSGSSPTASTSARRAGATRSAPTLISRWSPKRSGGAPTMPPCWSCRRGVAARGRASFP